MYWVNETQRATNRAGGSGGARHRHASNVRDPEVRNHEPVNLVRRREGLDKPRYQESSDIAHAVGQCRI